MKKGASARAAERDKEKSSDYYSVYYDFMRESVERSLMFHTSDQIGKMLRVRSITVEDEALGLCVMENGVLKLPKDFEIQKYYKPVDAIKKVIDDASLDEQLTVNGLFVLGFKSEDGRDVVLKELLASYLATRKNDIVNSFRVCGKELDGYAHHNVEMVNVMRQLALIVGEYEMERALMSGSSYLINQIERATFCSGKGDKLLDLIFKMYKAIETKDKVGEEVLVNTEFVKNRLLKIMGVIQDMSEVERKKMLNALESNDFNLRLWDCFDGIDALTEEEKTLIEEECRKYKVVHPYVDSLLVGRLNSEEETFVEKFLAVTNLNVQRKYYLEKEVDSAWQELEEFILCDVVPSCRDVNVAQIAALGGYSDPRSGSTLFNKFRLMRIFRKHNL